MTTKKLAYTAYKNADNKRVWVYWFSDRPEFVPGYWNLDDNTEAREWCEKMNEFVKAIQDLFRNYKDVEATIRYTMVALDFTIIEDFDPKYNAA